MHRHNLQFPTKETALREDVHALGSLVGEVLRDQGGESLLKLVEEDRVAAIGRREGVPEGTVTLDMRATDRPVQQASDLIRAFSKWFEVVNLAERVHRVRRRREYMNRGDRPQPGGIGDCMYRLKADGLDGEQVLALLRNVTIYPVFTAHPTESTRRTMLRKQQQIADLMIERLDPTLTPAERRSADPRSGEIRRHHVGDQAFQRAMGASASPPRRTRCATRSPRTCSRAERTCGSSRSCSGMRVSARHSSIRT